MSARETPLRPHGCRGDAARLLAASASETRSQRIRRLRCTDVARNRAQRYARRHRKAKSFLPLISAAIFAALLLERWPEAFSFRKKKLPHPGKAGPLPIAEDDDRRAAQVWIGEGEGKPRYRPPADFLATRKEVIQIVAFLIRNQGKLDTDPVRMKWEILDRASLPLAIFLREIKAASAWDDLEAEIAAARFDVPRAPGMGLPKSIRHRKILRLMPEWTRRGEDILSPEPVDDDSPAATPGIDNDDPDRKPLKP